MSPLFGLFFLYLVLVGWCVAVKDNDPLTLGTVRIPRESNLSLRDFYEQYADTQTPVIIDDYSKCFEDMTVSIIKEICGFKNASVAVRKNDKGSWASVEWRKAGPLREVIRGMEEISENMKGSFEPKEGAVVGIFDWNLQKHCPEVLEDYFRMPKYFAQDFLQRVPHDTPLNYRDSWPSLFVGVDGTYSALHRDTFGSAFWMYVLEGAKEWHIIDSVDKTDDFYKNPNIPTRHYHEIVETGELLIVPGDRWHQVRNRGKTVSLAGNIVTRGSFETMKREVKKKKFKESASYYRELWQTLLQPGFNTTIDFDRGDMTWKKYRSQADDTLVVEGSSVLVAAAGSPEVNGLYYFTSMYMGAPQFKHHTDDGRVFELFRVNHLSGWWNIMEVEPSMERVHYGAVGSGLFPPTDGWVGKTYNEVWVGLEPTPQIKLLPVGQATPSIFVINLAHRTERMEAFDEQTKSLGLNYTRVEAVDKVLSQKLLDEGLARVDDTFRDPVLRRRLKLGEVGCALSHIKAWEKIAALPDNEYGIVMEDDAKFVDIPEGFVAHLNAVTKAATLLNNMTDFVYLGYKELRESYKVDELFRSCVYSYWAIAYMISSKAAQKLMADADSYRFNLIPSDEYLPIILGTLDDECDHEAECSRQYPNVRLSCLAINEKLVKPRGHDGSVSDTEVSELVPASYYSQDTHDDLLVLTVATDKSHYGYKTLKRTTDIREYKLVTLGHEQAWNGEDMRYSEKGNMKLARLKSYLSKMEDEEQLILFTDGYDTVFQFQPDILLQRYEGHPADIVFAAELQCWPDEALCQQYAKHLSDEDSPFRYLNSGNYIGRVKHIKHVLELYDEEQDQDDQRFFSRMFCESLDGALDVTISLDMHCEMFQPLNGMEQDDWKLERNLSAYYFHNDITSSDPVILNANGGTKRWFVGITNYIAHGYTDFYKTQHHIPFPDIVIYPLALGLFFVGSHFEEDFLERTMMLNLEWSKVHLFVHHDQGLMVQIDNELRGKFRSVNTTVGGSDCHDRSRFLMQADSLGARFAVMLDSDIFINQETTVANLAAWNETVVAGHARREADLWSNFWTDISEEGWYKHGFDSEKLYKHERTGFWQVPYAHSLLVFRGDILEKMAGYYWDNRLAEQHCTQLTCMDALNGGIGFFVDNRYLYATLLDENLTCTAAL